MTGLYNRYIYYGLILWDYIIESYYVNIVLDHITGYITELDDGITLGDNITD